eukprot:5568-Heterococcus_DN1.PRE.1
MAQINVDTGAGARKTRLPDEIERQLSGRIVWMLDHNVPVAWEHVKLAANALAAIVDHQSTFATFVCPQSVLCFDIAIKNEHSYFAVSKGRMDTVAAHSNTSQHQQQHERQDTATSDESATQ